MVGPIQRRQQKTETRYRWQSTRPRRKRCSVRSSTCRREKAGLIDPTEDQRKRPLADHIKEFESYLNNKGVTPKQTKKRSPAQRMVNDRRWRMINDVSASGALDFLGQLRRDGLSAQTYNHYLKAAKQFTRWLVRDRRTPLDALAHLSRLNVRRIGAMTAGR